MPTPTATGRPIEYSNEQVIEAGKRLQAENRNITGFALRQRVGGGTPSRLKQVWDEYVASLGTVETAPAAELPAVQAVAIRQELAALVDRLAAAEHGLEQACLYAATERSETIKALAGRIEALAGERDKERETVAQLRGQVAALTSQVDRLTIALANRPALPVDMA